MKSASNTTDSLLDAARRIFVAEGVRALTVRRVATEAGCTTMAVYTQFGGKLGIVAALFDEGFALLRAAQAAVPANADAAQYLLHLCRAYRHTAHGHRHHYALMLGQFSGEFSPPEPSIRMALGTFETLVQASTEYLASLPTQPTERLVAEQLAQNLFALSHGWVSLEQAGFLSTQAEGQSALFDAAVLNHLSGLLQAPGFESAAAHGAGPALG